MDVISLNQRDITTSYKLCHGEMIHNRSRWMFMHLSCWVMNTVEEQRGYPIKCLGNPPRTALPNDPAKYFQLEYCFD